MNSIEGRLFQSQTQDQPYTQKEVLSKIREFSYEGGYYARNLALLYYKFLSCDRVIPSPFLLTGMNNNPDKEIYENISKEIEAYSYFTDDQEIGNLVKRHIVALDSLKLIAQYKVPELTLAKNQTSLAEKALLVGLALLFTMMRMLLL